MPSRVSWAVLLCKVSDDSAEPFTIHEIRERFTVAGQGTPNAVDYWSEASFGNLDISGTTVFGWLTLAQRRSDYVGSGANESGRWDLVTWARDAAKRAEVDLAKFDGTIVITNVDLDEWGVFRTVVLGPSVVDLTNVCHEMGHGHGFEHSRNKSRPGEDYLDPWDIMSANLVHAGSLPQSGRCGPFLNAALSRAAGWLPAERIWDYVRSDTAPFAQTVVLRPLHRPDLPGFLAATFGEFIVEFRVPDRWDVGIPRPGVLIHSYDAGRSYLHPNDAGVRDLQQGDTYGFAAQKKSLDSIRGGVIGGESGIRVLNIDPGELYATIEFVARPGRDIVIGPAISITGADAGGGGLVIIGGKLVRIPPRQPSLRLVELIALYQAAEDLEESALSSKIKTDVLQAFEEVIQQQRQQLARRHEC